MSRESQAAQLGLELEVPIVSLDALPPEIQDAEIDRLVLIYGDPVPAIVTSWIPLSWVTGESKPRPERSFS